MGWGKELKDTLLKLTALETRTEDAIKAVERLDGRVTGILDRLSRLETQYSNLRENVGNKILADIKADLAITQMQLLERSKQVTKSESIQAIEDSSSSD